MSTYEDACEVQATASRDRDLLVWTICANPSDFPGRYTARPHSTFSGRPLEFVLVADGLDAIRALLPPGLSCLARAPTDDPVILETWV